MGAVVFTADDVAEMEAFNEANLGPDTVGLRHGTRTYEPGGTLSKVVWDGGDPTWTELTRVSPNGTPQERITAGSIQDVNELFVILRKAMSVPRDYIDTNTGLPHFYRLEWTHTIAGLVVPFLLYDLRMVEIRSVRMLTKVLCSTTAPQ